MLYILVRELLARPVHHATELAASMNRTSPRRSRRPFPGFLFLVSRHSLVTSSITLRMLASLRWDIVVEVLPPCLGFCTFWLNFGCPRRKCDPRRLDRWELSSGVVLGLRPTDFLHERRTVRERQHIGSTRQISTMILATTKMGSRSFSRAASKSASFL